MALVQLLTALDSREDALALAYATVDARLAACAQVLGPIPSVYRWEGEVQEAEEFLCLIKTPSERLDELVAFVRDGHPYDTPELTVVESLYTDPRYLEWAQKMTIE
jgi:periplasmic divalent cation tolerance protein